MSRLQLALNVNDIDEAVSFYARLFGTEPAKRRPGYANFAIAEPPLKLVLLEYPGQGGTLNHLGVEVDTTAAVEAEQARLTEAGPAAVEERDTTCCYARQDKFWVTGAPGSEQWEIYTVLQDSPTGWRPAPIRRGTGPAGRAARNRAHRQAETDPRPGQDLGPGPAQDGLPAFEETYEWMSESPGNKPLSVRAGVVSVRDPRRAEALRRQRAEALFELLAWARQRRSEVEAGTRCLARRHRHPPCLSPASAPVIGPAA